MPPPLHALVYVSTANHLLAPPEVEHLLQRARVRNAQEDLSGVLLYNDGNFMQYLEGPKDGLARIYRIIGLDPQHHGLIELLHEPVPRREFGGWPLAFLGTGPRARVRPDGTPAGLAKRLAAGGPSQSTASQLLSQFWNRGGQPLIG